jgi:hypothetical protein
MQALSTCGAESYKQFWTRGVTPRELGSIIGFPNFISPISDIYLKKLVNIL